MKRVVIMQPTYLPWVGYFDLMDQADCFVLLDTVQFARQSWQQRNRIKTAQGAQWLTVPVVREFPQRIDQVKINNTGTWAMTHWRTVEQNYRRAACWSEYAGALEKLFMRRWERLAELNSAFIQVLHEQMGIVTPLVRASEMALTGQRESLLLNLCQQLGATVYLSPLGSAVYLQDDAPFAAKGIRVEFQHYEHPEYQQLYPPFVSHLSALDLLLNEGAGSLEILRAGRRTAYSTAEAAQMMKPIPPAPFPQREGGEQFHDTDPLSS